MVINRKLRTRSQVWGSALRFGLRPHKQGSTFRVKDKEGINYYKTKQAKK
jgi:hypothetical protein